MDQGNLCNTANVKVEYLQDWGAMHSIKLLFVFWILPLLVNCIIFFSCVFIGYCLKLSPRETWLVTFLILSQALFPAAVFCCIFRKRALEIFGIHQLKFLYILISTVVYPLVIIFTVLFERIAQPLIDVYYSFRSVAAETLSYIPMTALVGTNWYIVCLLSIAFFEELLYRASLFKFGEKANPRLILFYSVFCYCFTSINPVMWPQRIFIGFMTGWTYQKTKSIWTCYLQRVIYIMLFRLIGQVVKSI
jgi:membrane protease YdiL (CAAX protease family)